MSPLDHELRAALHARAQDLAPSPDPLAGIERRAGRIRRNRMGAAVAGSVLAVALVAVAVPAVQTATSQRDVPQVAQTSPPEQQRSYALDPAAPWAFRGTPVDEGTRAAIEREYATRTRGTDVTVTPLFAQVYEVTQQLEVVFVADVDGTPSWGVAVTSEAGPEFVWDQPLRAQEAGLAAALRGDEVPRLLVVAAPETLRLEYVPGAGQAVQPMAELAEGVGVIALEGDRDSDEYRVSWPGGGVVTDEAPDGDAVDGGRPDNVLDWGVRGAPLDRDMEEKVLALYRGEKESADGEPLHTGVTYSPLFTGGTDGGVRFTVGQAWVAGRPAQLVSYSEGGTEGEQFFLGRPVELSAPVVLFQLCCEPGSSTDTLVVVPQPGTGQVLYDDDDTGSFRPVGEGQDGLDGVVLVDRDRRADRDRLQLLDGDGDLDAPTFEGPVAPLLCGARECG